MKSVKLNDIVEKLDFYMDGWKLYYNKRTGKFVEIQEEYLRVAEELDEEDIVGYRDWEQEVIKEAIDIIENWDDYIKLLDKYEVDEYRIMENFCYSIEDERLSNKLCNAISGRGAFRRFKDAIIRYNLEDSWYSYKHKALCEVAKDWCEANDIPFVEE
ncbi:hypothetical protein Desca_1813 [Desulfotomaculum nigrificans CO-1-SRB]|uniref:Uncharacterized protein n=1 Tax=Desulfotomaculum nigrificans (strain DSM 14880 / VKM B-2319 / CO-1-SRB) TaxID=868595 RepID=F6B896_DESCC|nr:UPF0158 family protein [Desulfotomaculum nigrificans]AEF94660.1 hypothetical protein Desca_1813 [Desulfotomaculum nigrificans CO-1-SRB]